MVLNLKRWFPWKRCEIMSVVSRLLFSCNEKHTDLQNVIFWDAWKHMVVITHKPCSYVMKFSPVFSLQCPPIWSWNLFCKRNEFWAKYVTDHLHQNSILLTQNNVGGNSGLTKYRAKFHYVWTKLKPVVVQLSGKMGDGPIYIDILHSLI